MYLRKINIEMILHGLEDVAIERYQNNLPTKEISCVGPQRRLVFIFI